MSQGTQGELVASQGEQEDLEDPEGLEGPQAGQDPTGAATGQGSHATLWTQMALYEDSFLRSRSGTFDEATPTPIENQQALAQRDLWLRRYAIERDPVNSYSEKLLGEELARDLVKTMWGGNRASQRLIQDLIPQG